MAIFWFKYMFEEGNRCTHFRRKQPNIAMILKPEHSKRQKESIFNLKEKKQQKLRKFESTNKSLT